MGDTSTANDVLDAISEAMSEDMGKALIVRNIVEGAVDPINPASGRTTNIVDYSINGIISAYDDRRIDGTQVLKGDMEAVLSIKELPVEIRPGFRIIDGPIDYEVVRVNLPEYAGIKVTAVCQLRR